MRKTHPYMARKMLEGMLNLVMPWIRLYVLWKTFCILPALTIVGICWKLFCYIRCIVGFLNEYHFARPYWWAAVLVSEIYLVSDWYSWATLGQEAWMTRRRVDKHD
jgi:hypothetical protein